MGAGDMLASFLLPENKKDTELAMSFLKLLSRLFLVLLYGLLVLLRSRLLLVCYFLFLCCHGSFSFLFSSCKKCAVLFSTMKKYLH